MTKYATKTIVLTGIHELTVIIKNGESHQYMSEYSDIFADNDGSIDTIIEKIKGKILKTVNDNENDNAMYIYSWRNNNTVSIWNDIIQKTNNSGYNSLNM